MKCPICGNDYRPYRQHSDFEQDGNTAIATHLFFCPNCESEWTIQEYFKFDSASLDPFIIVEGKQENFEKWRD